MITCPWCGTNYAAFQSNCDRCGGPLPLPADPAASRAEGAPPTPPPAPRQVADSYAWRLLVSDGWGVVGFIFTLLGAIFTLVGGGLTLGVITAFVGLPFLLLGLVFLLGGGAVGPGALSGGQANGGRPARRPGRGRANCARGTEPTGQGQSTAPVDD